MDSSSIQSITDLALAADGKRFLGTDIPTILLRTAQGERIASLEEFRHTRARYRGTFSTESLDAFVRHVDHQLKAVIDTDERENAVGFIDAKAVTAEIFFNLGTAEKPGQGDHRALLDLPRTAAYTALLSIVGKRLTQRDLAEWVEDWRDFLTPITAGTPSGDSIAKVIAAIRDITVTTAREVNKVERDLGSTTSAMASVDAQSKHELPEGFGFTCEPYAGLPSREFRVRLRATTTDDKIALTLRIQQAEKASEDIAKDFEQVLKDALGENVTLAVGAFAP